MFPKHAVSNIIQFHISNVIFVFIFSPDTETPALFLPFLIIFFDDPFLEISNDGVFFSSHRTHRTISSPQVLENNLAAVKHVTVKLLAKHLTPAEGLRELLEPNGLPPHFD